ncbi:hypothetical protein HOF78_03425 [Candidatus Woesearchaeota archaeon]|jgi:hypothetical protein|nr:hypothetical protein [Candidatus Woesearchaeota archaeon]MBT6044512.1 hypothetical protein [Candidatus Woesearchaeota archaeon]
MKMKKLYSIMVISMFIIGMLPAVFAQEIIDVSDRVNVQAIDSTGIQAAPMPGEVEGPIVLRPISRNVAGGPTTTIGTVDTDSVGIERKENNVEKERRERKVNNLFKRMKGNAKKTFRELEGEWNPEKADKLVRFAAHLSGRGSDVASRMVERLENNPDSKFLEAHPNAIEKISNLQMELDSSYAIFYEALDGEDLMTEEEYRAIVPELKELGLSIRDLSRNQDVRDFVKNNKQKIIERLKAKHANRPGVRASIERLENAGSSKEREEAMEEVRTSVIEVSSDRVSVELAEDTAVAV